MESCESWHECRSIVGASISNIEVFPRFQNKAFMGHDRMWTNSKCSDPLDITFYSGSCCEAHIHTQDGVRSVSNGELGWKVTDRGPRGKIHEIWSDFLVSCFTTWYLLQFLLFYMMEWSWKNRIRVSCVILIYFRTIFLKRLKIEGFHANPCILVLKSVNSVKSEISEITPFFQDHLVSIHYSSYEFN